MAHGKLASRKKIMRFALVWAQMYKNHKNIPGAFFEDPLFVGEGMTELGFQMDCGESLGKKFPDVSLSADNPKAWEKALEVIDLQTLGNAIFSQWRYFNHWNCTPMRKEDIKWFVLSFTRLAELAEQGR